MRHSIRFRLAIAFVGMAVAAGITAALLALVFAYTTEDHVFDNLLQYELDYLNRQLHRGDGLPQPRLPFVRYYTDQNLPASIANALQRNPGGREVFDPDGDHFHLRRSIASTGAPDGIWLVAEVQDFLAVRPLRNEIFRFLAWVILCMTVLAVLVGIWLAYRITQPLKKLATMVSTVDPASLPRDFAADYHDDETARLAMALQTSFTRIEHFVLREKRFTQDASHELRTPVAVVQNAAELLHGSTLSPQQAALVARIHSASAAMHQTIEALLALAREDIAILKPRTIAVLPVVERAIVHNARLLDDSSASVTVDIGSDWMVWGNAAALQILVSNLVANAFEYAESGEIHIFRDGSSLCIRNPGTTILDDQAGEVTQPAVRGTQSKGLGLGLSIVERICERYGWVFQICSENNMTEAKLRFPDRATPPREAD